MNSNLKLMNSNLVELPDLLLQRHVDRVRNGALIFLLYI